jgi:hypothetical protein
LGRLAVEANEKDVPMSLAARLTRVFFSPGDVFERLREEPSWFGALAVGALLVVLSLALIPAEIWVQAMRERAAEQGAELPSLMASAGPLFRLAGIASGVVFWFAWAFLLAGIVTVAFAFFLGDDGRYAQYLAVVSHALVISAFGAVLLGPLRIYRGDPSFTLNLGTFFPFLGEGYAFRVLKLLDLFGLWGYAVIAVGVTKIDPRRGIAAALTFSWAFALAFAMVFGVFGG